MEDAGNLAGLSWLTWECEGCRTACRRVGTGSTGTSLGSWDSLSPIVIHGMNHYNYYCSMTDDNITVEGETLL